MNEDERRVRSLALAEKVHDALKTEESVEVIAFMLVTLLESAPNPVMKRMQELAASRAIAAMLVGARRAPCDCEKCRSAMS